MSFNETDSTTPSCRLTSAEGYEEVLSIKAIDAPGQLHDLVIKSRLDSAKDPAATRVRHRLAVDRDGLERLHAYLGQYLVSSSGNKSGG